MKLKLSVLIALATLQYSPQAEPVPMLENPKQSPPKQNWFDRPCISNTYNGQQNRKQRRMNKGARRR